MTHPFRSNTGPESSEVAWTAADVSVRPDLSSPLFDPPLDADEVADRLWQGGAPPLDARVRRAGFDLLVLCAEEYQPPEEAFAGVRVLHAPNEDAPDITPRQWRGALDASREVAAALRRGEKVLVTCAAGLNRSGLVSALAMLRLAGAGADASAIVAQVQSRRFLALCNDRFVELVHLFARDARRRAARQR
ncbi:MAG: hypothetical protein RL199_1193 [Pseudomonadota bacterium]